MCGGDAEHTELQSIRLGALGSNCISLKLPCFDLQGMVHLQLQAQKMQSQGWTLVDVRIEGDYEKNHAKGAICVPLFRFVQGTSFW